MKQLWLFLLFPSILLSGAKTASSTASYYQYTDNGYDNIDGIHSVCWVAHALPPNVLSEAVDPFASDIAIDSSLFSSVPAQLRNCPIGNEVNVIPPFVDQEKKEILRTNKPYQFQLSAEVDLSTIRQQFNLTQEATLYRKPQVAGRISFCQPSGRFCTPYIPTRVKHYLETYSNEEERHRDDKSDAGSIQNQPGIKDSSQIHPDTETTQERIAVLANATTDWQLYNISQPYDDILQLNYSFSVTMTNRGQYLPLGVVQIILNDSGELFKIDIANLLHTEEIFFEDLPDVRTVQAVVELIAYIGIGIVGTFELWLLFYAVKHRNESVMKMSQGSFLIMLQIAGLIATFSSFLLEPKSDNYCRLGIPMTLLPIQFMLAVIFGRLLRIVSIMGDLMDWNNTKSNSHTRGRKAADRIDLRAGLKRLSATFRTSMRPIMRDGEQHDGIHTDRREGGGGSTSRNPLANSFKGSINQTVKKARKIRRNFTVTWLWITIAAIMSPQVAIQILRLSLFDTGIIVHFKDDQSIGRLECGSVEEQYANIGCVMVSILTLFAALFQAHKSRKLPALFNEAASVSTVLLSTLLVTMLGFMIISASTDPTSSPDVPYLMMITVVLTISLSISIRLVLPKLLLVWKGEKVVITQIMKEHRKKQQRKQGGNRIVEIAGRSFGVLVGRISSQGSGAIFSLGPSFRVAVPPKKPIDEDNRKSGMGGSRTSGRPGTPSIDQKPPSHPSSTLGEMKFSITNSCNTEQQQQSLGRKSSSTRRCSGKDASIKVDGDPEGSIDIWHSDDIKCMDPEDHSLRLEDIPHPLKQAKALITTGGDHYDEDDDYNRAYIIEEGHAPPSDVTVNVVHLTQCVSNINHRILTGLHVDQADWRELQENLEDTKMLLDMLEFR